MMMGIKNSIKAFEGVVNNLEKRLLETDKLGKRRDFTISMNTECERCNGLRLKDEAYV